MAHASNMDSKHDGLESQRRTRHAYKYCLRLVHQAIALSLGLIDASSPLTSAAGRGGLNR
jgi:hypothetical protein